MEKRRLKVGDVAREAGLTRQQIHMYTMMGLINPVEETPGGHRLFAPDVLTVIDTIRELNKSGYTLRDIKDIFLKKKA